MTNFNTYNMNSFTTTSLPTHLKYLHLSLEVKYHYLYMHKSNTSLIQSQCQHLPVATTTLLNDDITYTKDYIDVAKTI